VWVLTIGVEHILLGGGLDVALLSFVLAFSSSYLTWFFAWTAGWSNLTEWNSHYTLVRMLKHAITKLNKYEVINLQNMVRPR
jgi:hypothetical protein